MSVETGELSRCASCGREIVFTGKYWEHVIGAYRHIPVPMEGQPVSVHIRGIGPDGQWLTKAERNDMSGDAIARLEAWKSASKHRGCSVYHTDSYDSTGWCCILTEGVGDTARRVNLISGPDDDWGYSMDSTINRALDAWEAEA